MPYFNPTFSKMKLHSISFLSLVLIFCVSCSEKKQSTTPVPEVHIAPKTVDTLLTPDFIEKHLQDFKLENQKRFSINDSIIENRQSLFAPLLEKDHLAVFQDRSPYSASELDVDYLYSKEFLDSNLTSFTLLESFDRYCYILSYRIYDKTGKLINAFPLAIRCADGGFSVDLKGEFLTDKKYRSISVETELMEKEGESSYEQYDSIVRLTEILPDGTIKETTLDSVSKKIPVLSL
jgi:hypothetical protein